MLPIHTFTLFICKLFDYWQIVHVSKKLFLTIKEIYELQEWSKQISTRREDHEKKHYKSVPPLSNNTG